MKKVCGIIIVMAVIGLSVTSCSKKDCHQPHDKGKHECPNHSSSGSTTTTSSSGTSQTSPT